MHTRDKTFKQEGCREGVFYHMFLKSASLILKLGSNMY